MLRLNDLFNSPQNDFLSNDYSLPHISSANDMGRIDEIMPNTSSGNYGVPDWLKSIGKMFIPQQQMQQGPIPNNMSGGFDPHEVMHPPELAPIMQQQQLPQQQQQFNPSYEHMNNLSDLYQNYPNKFDYAPSMGRRIMGSLSSLAGMGPATYYNGTALGIKSDPEQMMKIQELYNYKPYYDAMQNFGVQEKGFGDLAKLEQSQNQNDRILYDSAENRRIQQQRADTDAERARNADEVARIRTAETERKNKESEDFKRDEAARKEKRDQAYIWKQTHPEMDAYTENGKLVFVDKTDPTRIIRTEVDSDKMSDQEKYDFKLKGDLQKIAAQGASNQALAATNNTNRLGQIAASGTEARTTKGTPSGNGTTKSGTNSPGNEKQARINRAAKLRADHPEWTNYISIQPNIGPVITKPASGRFGSGPNQNDYDYMNKMIFGTAIDTGNNPNSVSGLNTGMSTNTNNDARVPVMDDKGNKFTLPASQVDSFLNEHKNYKRF